MSSWVPVVITVVLGVAGLVVQGFLLAYFLGRMKAQQEGAAALVKAQQEAAAALVKAQQEGAAALVETFKDFTRMSIAALTERLDAVDEFATNSREHRATLDARLTQVERNTEGLQGVREAMAAMAATFKAHRERQEADMAHVNRSLEGVQRQLGNLATGGGGRIIQLGEG